MATSWALLLLIAVSSAVAMEQEKTFPTKKEYEKDIVVPVEEDKNSQEVRASEINALIGGLALTKAQRNALQQILRIMPSKVYDRCMQHCYGVIYEEKKIRSESEVLFAVIKAACDAHSHEQVGRNAAEDRLKKELRKIRWLWCGGTVAVAWALLATIWALSCPGLI